MQSVSCCMQTKQNCKTKESKVRRSNSFRTSKNVPAYRQEGEWCDYCKFAEMWLCYLGMHINYDMSTKYHNKFRDYADVINVFYKLNSKCPNCSHRHSNKHVPVFICTMLIYLTTMNEWIYFQHILAQVYQIYVSKVVKNDIWPL